jgi:hypothetical protein
MKLKVLLPLFLLISSLLAGCESGPGSETGEVANGEPGFITDVNDKDEVLIKDAYYSVTKDTDIQSSSGKKLDLQSLKIGMKTKVWFIGDITETMPSHARAKLILIQEDEKSLKERNAVIAAINAIKKASSQRFLVLDLTHIADEAIYRIEMMNRSNLDTSFTLSIDENTYKVLYQE